MPSARTASRDLDVIAERLRPLGDLEVSYGRVQKPRWRAYLQYARTSIRSDRGDSTNVEGTGDTPLEAAQSLFAMLTTLEPGDYIESAPAGDSLRFVWDGMRFRRTQP
jgi:hypothetical protein